VSAGTGKKAIPRPPLLLLLLLLLHPLSLLFPLIETVASPTPPPFGPVPPVDVAVVEVTAARGKR
jgi:hypothetical protein